MNISSTEVNMLAKQAADSFVQGGGDLSQEIAKIAENRDLSRVQIQRVVEQTNHQVNSLLYKKAGVDERTFSFNLASVDNVMSFIKEAEGPTKVAEYRLYGAIKAIKHRDATSELSKIASRMHESDPRTEEILDAEKEVAITKIAQKIETVKSHLKSEKLAALGEIHEGLQKLAQVAKNHVLRGNDFLDLYKFAYSADPDSVNTWRVIFGAVKGDLEKLGYPIKNRVKNVQLPSKVKIERVDGNHKLLVELDTLKNKIDEVDKISNRLRLMDLHGPAVVDKIRHFKNPDSVDKWLKEDVYALANAPVAKFEEGLNKAAGFKDTAKLVGKGAAAGAAFPFRMAARGGLGVINQAVKHPKVAAGVALGTGALAALLRGTGRVIDAGSKATGIAGGTPDAGAMGAY